MSTAVAPSVNTGGLKNRTNRKLSICSIFEPTFNVLEMYEDITNGEHFKLAQSPLQAEQEPAAKQPRLEKSRVSCAVGVFARFLPRQKSGENSHGVLQYGRVADALVATRGTVGNKGFLILRRAIANGR